MGALCGEEEEEEERGGRAGGDGEGGGGGHPSSSSHLASVEDGRGAEAGPSRGKKAVPEGTHLKEQPREQQAEGGEERGDAPPHAEAGPSIQGENRPDDDAPLHPSGSGVGGGNGEEGRARLLASDQPTGTAAEGPADAGPSLQGTPLHSSSGSCFATVDNTARQTGGVEEEEEEEGGEEEEEGGGEEEEERESGRQVECPYRVAGKASALGAGSDIPKSAYFPPWMRR